LIDSKSAGTLVINSLVPYNQYCNGFDVNPSLTRIAIVDNLAGAPEGLLTRGAYTNGAPAPLDSFRVYSYSPLAAANATSLVFSQNTHQHGQSVRYSNDGKMLALTQAPSLAVTIIPDPTEAGLLSLVYPPCTVQVLRATGDQYDDVITKLPAPAPVLALALAWSNDDKQLIVGGMASPVQADIVVYNVTQ